MCDVETAGGSLLAETSAEVIDIVRYVILYADGSDGDGVAEELEHLVGITLTQLSVAFSREVPWVLAVSCDSIGRDDVTVGKNAGQLRQCSHVVP